jgi:hypothetical protein
MNRLKQALTALGSLMVVAIGVTLIAPKTVHAVVAAAVQIMNTSANPVPTYDSGTRFQADVCDAVGPVSTAYNFCGTNTSVTFVVPTTTSSGATVKRLIVDNVSGYCSSFNNPTIFIKTVRLAANFVPDSVPNGETTAVHYIPIVAPTYSYVNVPGGVLGNVPETDYTYGQTTHFSFNPGDTVTLGYEYWWPGGGSADASCLARIDGMLATD